MPGATFDGMPIADIPYVLSSPSAVLPTAPTSEAAPQSNSTSSGSWVQSITNIASMISIITGPIGIAGGVVATVGELVQGNYGSAALTTGTTFLNAGGIGLIKAGVSLAAKLGREAVQARTLAASAEQAAHIVYQGIDKSGVVRYIGITARSVGVREAEHVAVGGGKELLRYEAIKGAANLTKTEAKVVEQKLINQYGLGKNGGQLLNKINSIADKYWVQYGIDP
jgi:hypothetical protein